jgi:hypothetical protein
MHPLTLTPEQDTLLRSLVLRHVQAMVNEAGKDETFAPEANEVNRGMLGLATMLFISAHSMGETLAKCGCNREDAEERLELLTEEMRGQFAAGHVAGSMGVVPDRI